MKEKIFGFLFIVIFIYGFYFIENSARTNLRSFYRCRPIKTGIPSLPILDPYHYKDFVQNYPNFFYEYTCEEAMYTRVQVNFINKRMK